MSVAGRLGGRRPQEGMAIDQKERSPTVPSDPEPHFNVGNLETWCRCTRQQSRQRLR
jgi:hypothetical protein